MSTPGNGSGEFTSVLTWAAAPALPVTNEGRRPSTPADWQFTRAGAPALCDRRWCRQRRAVVAAADPRAPRRHSRLVRLGRDRFRAHARPRWSSPDRTRAPPGSCGCPDDDAPPTALATRPPHRAAAPGLGHCRHDAAHRANCCSSMRNCGRDKQMGEFLLGPPGQQEAKDQPGNG